MRKLVEWIGKFTVDLGSPSPLKESHFCLPPPKRKGKALKVATNSVSTKRVWYNENYEKVKGKLRTNSEKHLAVAQH